MESKIWFDEKYLIIRCVVNGPFAMDDVKNVIVELRNLFDSCKSSLLLVDTNHAARMIPACQERKEITERIKELKWKKLAVVGTDSYVRLSAKLILSIFSKSRTVQFFKGEREAIYWLKDGQFEKTKEIVQSMPELNEKA